MSGVSPPDLLLTFYRHADDQARHHDDQNAKVASLVLALTGGVLGLLRLSVERPDANLWLGLFLVALGGYGAVFSIKHYERHLRKKRTAHRYRSALENCLPEAGLTELRKEAEKVHKTRFSSWLVKLHLYKLWLAVYLFVIALGVGVMTVALMDSGGRSSGSPPGPSPAAHAKIR